MGSSKSENLGFLDTPLIRREKKMNGDQDSMANSESLGRKNPIPVEKRTAFDTGD